MEFLPQTLSRSPDAIGQLVTLLVRSRGGRQQHVSLTYASMCDREQVSRLLATRRVCGIDDNGCFTIVAWNCRRCK